MTHHATNLDLPGEANITTAAGDVATFQSTGSNTVQCINYTKADGSGIAGGGGINDNVLINGEMRIDSTLGNHTATNAFPNDDDSYPVDRWLLLSDGDDIVDLNVTSVDGGTSGEDNYMRLDVETTAKKFGIAQIIENDNCRHMLGGSQVVSLSFEATVSDAAKLSDVRAAVLSWNSTADTVTSDFVNTWDAEGAGFTPATNWTLENTPVNLSVTTSWVKYTIENISIDTASTKNIAVFIWSDNVATNDTAGSLLKITKVKLELGSAATTFISRSLATERNMCLRHRWSLGAFSYFPGRGNNADESFVAAFAPVRMFATPTAVTDNLGIVGYSDSVTAQSATSDSITGIAMGADGNSISFATGTFSALADNKVAVSCIASGEFWFVAEL